MAVWFFEVGSVSHEDSSDIVNFRLFIILCESIQIEVGPDASLLTLGSGSINASLQTNVGVFSLVVQVETALTQLMSAPHIFAASGDNSDSLGMYVEQGSMLL